MWGLSQIPVDALTLAELPVRGGGGGGGGGINILPGKLGRSKCCAKAVLKLRSAATVLAFLDKDDSIAMLSLCLECATFTGQQTDTVWSAAEQNPIKFNAAHCCLNALNVDCIQLLRLARVVSHIAPGQGRSETAVPVRKAALR